MTLPEPQCRLGYTDNQLRVILPEPSYSRFKEWMVGKTFSTCTGKEYDHDLKACIPSGCGPHGVVYYETDVRKFLTERRKT